MPNIEPFCPRWCVKRSKSGRENFGCHDARYPRRKPHRAVEGEETANCRSLNLRQLNSLNQHPNIPHLLAYNTTTVPFHIITQYEKYGDLLQLVRTSREVKALSSSVIYKMLISITEGLLYLQQKLHLVHRALMAENILVGDGYTCKLTGLHSLGKLPHKRHGDGKINCNENNHSSFS